MYLVSLESTASGSTGFEARDKDRTGRIVQTVERFHRELVARASVPNNPRNPFDWSWTHEFHEPDGILDREFASRPHRFWQQAGEWWAAIFETPFDGEMAMPPEGRGGPVGPTEVGPPNGVVRVTEILNVIRPFVEGWSTRVAEWATSFDSVAVNSEPGRDEFWRTHALQHILNYYTGAYSILDTQLQATGLVLTEAEAILVSDYLLEALQIVRTFVQTYGGRWWA